MVLLPKARLLLLVALATLKTLTIPADGLGVFFTFKLKLNFIQEQKATDVVLDCDSGFDYGYC